jgi:hypothetical protein
MPAAQDIEAILTKENVVAWLRAQDPATEYDFTDSTNCLLCRFLRDRGVQALAGSRTISPFSDLSLDVDIPAALTKLSGRSNPLHASTYGEALRNLTAEAV